MNVIQLQDMLRGLPDDRLKQELSQPTGSVPQYLVLSEVVRRDKMREATASAPQSTVLQDIIGTPQPAQQQPQAFANGGFITPAQAMGNAGVRGFEPQQQKQPMQFGFNSGGPQMFVPNTTPQPPAPVTNNNINVPPPTISAPAPQFDGGMNDGPNAPSFYEQPNGYADGGIIGLAGGGGTRDVIVSRLQGLGYTPAAIAAILGAAEAESSFNPKAEGSAGEVGIFQWRGPRLDALKDFAASRGGDIYDPAIQTDFLDNELRTTEGRAGKALFNAQTPEEAAIGMMHYERPAGYKRDDPTAGHNWSGRLGAAQNYYNTLSDGQAPAPSNSNTPAPNQEASSSMMNPADRELGILSGGVMPDPKERGIGSLLAGIMGRPSVSKDMMSLGSSMVARGQENRAPEAPGLTRGDPSLVQSIGGPSVDEMLAQYQALRSGYMANGGAVRMRDGMAVPSLPSWATESILPDDFFNAPDFTGTPTFENPEGRPFGDRFPDLVEPEPVDTSISTPMDPNWTPPEKFTKKPAPGIFDEPPAPEKPSAFEEYLAYLKARDEKLAAEYKTQEEEELARQKEAGGLPFLLRQLGIGMIATGGNLGEGLRGGLGQAFSAREEQTQAARDKIRELQLKQRLNPIESEAEIQRLRYEAAVAADKEARTGGISKEKYFEEANKLDAEIVKAMGEGATPESLAEMRQLAAMYRSLAGLSGNIGSAPYIYDPAQKGIAPR